MMLASTDSKEYRTQFFQRAVFEQHAEFAGTPNEVLLKLVGQTFYERHFQTTPPPSQTVNPTNTLTFKETGHSTGGKFRDYWEKHGCLAQQGYPMTGEFKMASSRCGPNAEARVNSTTRNNRKAVTLMSRCPVSSKKEAHDDRTS